MDKDVGIIVVEVLPISTRLISANRKSSTPSVFCAGIEKILRHHGFSNTVLVAHSYGTFLAAHLLRDPVGGKNISSVVLMDPIVFLLHIPDVVYNFVYRKPGRWRANEWLIWYFSSRDLGIATLLARRFFWAQGALWKEDPELSSREVVVVLSDGDQIIAADKVWGYLTKEHWGKGAPVGSSEEERSIDGGSMHNLQR